MKKIDKLLNIARQNEGRKDRAGIDEVLARMTTNQLNILVYGDPSEIEIRKILASVGGLHLLESG